MGPFPIGFALGLYMTNKKVIVKSLGDIEFLGYSKSKNNILWQILNKANIYLNKTVFRYITKIDVPTLN